MVEISIDDRRTLIIPGDGPTTVSYAAEHWYAICQNAISQRGLAFIALSGGSTPKAIFQQLTTLPLSEKIPWDKIHFFWSDERSVPPHHPDSNYHMAMESGLKNMPIPLSHIHRMHAEEDIAYHAKKYEELICQIVPKSIFDLIMLGMGDDGHTASLFPGTEGLAVTDRLIVANLIPQKNTWRMSMTYPCINSARNITLYVVGASKQAMLKQVLHGPYNPQQLPSQKVGTPAHKALWIADLTASSGLTKI